VKVLAATVAADPERRRRLEREARIAGSLNHPHICTLHDIGEAPLRPEPEPSVWYLVMEYVQGITLGERLAQGRLPPDQALAFATQIADALDKAHRRGIVHRDLKPANVMLTSSGVKLLDFGLAMQRSPVGGAAARAPHRGRRHRRHAAVHGARATGGPGGRRAHGHLRLRRARVRDGHRGSGVSEREPGRTDRRHPP
jgi:serine/threonine protein kinase